MELPRMLWTIMMTNNRTLAQATCSRYAAIPYHITEVSTKCLNSRDVAGRSTHQQPDIHILMSNWFTVSFGSQ